METIEIAQNGPPRPPYEEFCYRALAMLKAQQPYYTTGIINLTTKRDMLIQTLEMLDLVWPDGNRLADWELLSPETKEKYRNRPRVEIYFPPLVAEDGHSLVPPLNFKSTRRDFKAVEIYVEEQFALRDEPVDHRRELRSQYHRSFANLTEVEKRRLRRKAHRRNVRKAAFLTLTMARPHTDFTTPEPDAHWIYIRPLGKGGFGRAYQMTRLDDNENVLEVWGYQAFGDSLANRKLEYGGQDHGSIRKNEAMGISKGWAQ